MYSLLVSDWLNNTFAGFDYGILNFYHNLAESTNYGIGWLFRFITSLAEHGYGMIALSMLMMVVPLVPAIRKKYPAQCNAVFVCGVISLSAIILGSVITNVTIKGAVARPRPYLASDIYHQWWELAGGNLDPEFSFPSGHTTCTMAVMTSIFLCGNKKKSWTAFIFAIVMGATRNYFMMHYPTDIIGGLIVGGVASIVAYLVWQKLVFKKPLKLFVKE